MPNEAAAPTWDETSAAPSWDDTTEQPVAVAEPPPPTAKTPQDYGAPEVLTPDQEAAAVGRVAREHPALENAAAGLADVAKGFIPHSLSDALGFVTPVVGAVEDMRKTAGTIRDIAAGKPAEEALRANQPEVFGLADAAKTAPYSRERFAAGFGTVAQMLMAGGIAHGLRPTLTDTLFPKPPETVAAPEVPPIELPKPEEMTPPQEVSSVAPEFSRTSEQVAATERALETTQITPAEGAVAPTEPILTDPTSTGTTGGQVKRDFQSEYPEAQNTVSGLKISNEVPNMDSIESSLGNHEVLPGIREVKMRDVNGQSFGTDKSYSVSEDARTNKLAERIKQAGEITPVIVVEHPDGPYILEGAHRVDALHRLGVDSFPAKVVIDKEAFDAAQPGKTAPAPPGDTGTGEGGGAPEPAKTSEALATPAEQVTPTDQPPRTTGIAQRVNEARAPGEILPGEGATPEDLIQQGRDDLKAGHDPESVAEKIDKGEAITPRETGLVRAQVEELSKVSDRASEEARKNPTPENKLTAEDAFKAETDFRQRIKPAATAASDVFKAYQGETNVETGTFNGLRRQVNELHGRDVTPDEVPLLEKTAERVQKAQTDATDALQKASEAIEQKVRPPKSKPRTMDELREHLAQRIKDLNPC